MFVSFALETIRDGRFELARPDAQFPFCGRQSSSPLQSKPGRRGARLGLNLAVPAVSGGKLE